MKSLHRRFDNLEEKRPFSSSLGNFNMACKDGKFSRDRIGRYFRKCVDKEDYSGSSVREILAYAYALSNPLNRTPNVLELPVGDEGNKGYGSLDVWIKQKREMAVISLFTWDEIAVLDRTVIHMGGEAQVG